MQKAIIRLLVLTIVSLILLLNSAAAHSADPGGRLEGLIGEREVSVELDVDQSDWYGDGNAGGVSMMSRPIAPKDGLGRFSIGFEGSDFRAGRFSNFEVDLGMVGSPGVYYRADLDDGLEVSFDQITREGELLVLEGRVRGTLTSQHLRDRTRDADDRLEIEIDFSVRIGNHF